MKHGFIKVASATPVIRVAECEYNADKIIEIIEESVAKDVKIIVFPELCITGYTCGDLFLQDILLKSAKEQMFRIASETAKRDIIAVVGIPYMNEGILYNVAAVLFGGKVMGLVPKENIPNYSEFYEGRHFSSGQRRIKMVSEMEYNIPFGTDILFKCSNVDNLTFAVEICEDLWVPDPPSTRHALAGATIIGNLSASDETTGKNEYRKELIKSQSARLVCGYIYADAGDGESTTDLVFTGHNIISENGSILKEAARFYNETIISEIDVNKIINERKRMTTYMGNKSEGYFIVPFEFEKVRETKLTRTFPKTPFVPCDKSEREKRCDEIINMQAMGLKKRLEHTGCKHAVIGISGGLDSTLALLVTMKAFDMLGIERNNIICVTMPCFGTTDRTYQNAVTLTQKLGATLKEIPINEAVELHLRDISHDINNHDITYENAQARERTQILMDLSNQNNGMVIGTGDMSELALGWATYNGDHMSMYGVNCSVPKTLVRYLVLYFADTTQDKVLSKILKDILDTPVSPELLPPKDGVISQKTEELVGPYELHDFYLYYIIRFGFLPSKVFRLAMGAFAGDYDKETILKWLGVFYKRFFAQQFKRSCLPDGPKVGSVSLSPRGDLRMPSDACARLWIKDLECL